jgi:hypothetical protein
MRKIEPDDPALQLHATTAGASPADPVVAAVAESGLENGTLPHDHPRWVHDAVALSSRARELVRKLKPIALRVMTMWDHRLRSIVVSGRRVSVDPSGSYRLGD